MSTYVYVAQSIDGFIAGKDGDMDWLNDIPNPEKSDFGFAEFIDKIDVIVMGRHTFEKVQSFGMWPYTKPVLVISKTLTELAAEYDGKARVLNLEPIQIAEYLKKEDLTNLYIDGGLLIQSFLKNDLIDELIITTVPVLLGEGIPLFGKLDQSLKFKFQRSEVLVNSLVKSYYIRER
jgi:dihydrofolate reductase